MFDKLILSQVINVTKTSNKLETSINLLQDNIIQQQKILINQIPGLENISSEQLLIPSSVCLVKPIPLSNKQNIENNINKSLKIINDIIYQKNQINQVLIKAQDSLNILNKTSNNIKNSLIALQSATIIIKSIPIPTAPSPIPANLIIGFSDSLATLNDLIKQEKGSISIIPSSITNITNSINNIINKLNKLDSYILPFIQLITFINILNKIGCGVSQEEINKEKDNIISNLNNFNNNLEQIQINDELSDYKNFKLEIQYDPNNKNSISSRRIKGYNPLTQQIIYNTTNGLYSFSASIQVLIDEIKYIIDNISS